MGDHDNRPLGPSEPLPSPRPSGGLHLEGNEILDGDDFLVALMEGHADISMAHEFVMAPRMHTALRALLHIIHHYLDGLTGRQMLQDAAESIQRLLDKMPSE